MSRRELYVLPVFIDRSLREAGGVETWRVVVEESSTSGPVTRTNLVVRDKLTGDAIVLDGVTGSVTVRATSALVLKADGLVSIEGAAVTVNGRPVLADPKPL